MNRYSAFTIKILDWSNSEFWELISNSVNEGCLYDQPNFKTDGVVWFDRDKVPKELFKYEGCFEWLSGSVDLWRNDIRVTKQNYRTVISKEDEPIKYDYLNWYRMTNKRPIIKIEE